ncbi:E22 family MetX-like putative esterase [Alteromonas sp. A079]|uniref:E22 family MetX-like putative esterase n=1 Tax=Alteromonas sp. A079 TaxID=3410268 RepID=UPI003BA375D3
MRPRTFIALAFTLFMMSVSALVNASSTAAAEASSDNTLIVEKQRFTLPSFETFNGSTIKQVNVGWEAYGELNDKKDNVILVTHYFSGTSHAAGKYTENDTQPGYWDAIIGPGKAIDTNKFFVVSVDTLVNLNAYDEHVITTGPASINPDTNKPYGLSFPVVTIRDFVNVQKALLESLDITSLYAVVGPSMGSMQAIDWASAYPDWVPRMISVIGAGESDGWTTAALAHWAMPIKLDSNWNNGNYTKETAPVNGLTASLMLISQHALSPEYFNAQAQSLRFNNLEDAPLNDINTSHSIVNWLTSRAASRAENMDANHLLYLVRACQLFVAGHQQDLKKGLSTIKAKTLFLPATTDLLLMPYLSEHTHAMLEDMGKDTAIDMLSGSLGHLEGVANVQAQQTRIRRFLEEK